MKKVFYISIIFLCLLTGQTVNAQDPITTLQHAGTTKVFYGTTSFADAYTSSAKGDTLYLSVGGFTPPAAIAKGITVIGAGHFPDSVTVKKRTTILGDIIIKSGADSLYLEGLYVNRSISFDNYSTTNKVSIKRCRSNSCGNGINNSNVTFDECIIEGYVGQSFGKNFLVRHCIISGQIGGLSSQNAVLDGNIFLYNANGPLSSVSSSTIKNNIFVGSRIFQSAAGGGETDFFYNNLFVSSSANFIAEACSGSSNYFSVPQANIFVNQSGNVFDYSHNYHLKSPTTYIGTDGTQVGLYGGLIPFKDGGAPSNPQITSKSVDTKTDANGNLKINFTVKAQDN